MRPRRPLGGSEPPRDDLPPDDLPPEDVPPEDAPTRVGPRPDARPPVGPEEEYRDVRDVPPPTVTEEVVGARRPMGPFGENPWPWLVALLLLVLGGLAAVYFLTRDNGDHKKAVPAVVGSATGAATASLRDAGFKPRVRLAFSTRAKGTVIRTDPTAGVKVKKGSAVLVFASKGPSFVNVPNLQGLSEAAAASKLTALGLKAKVFRVPSDKPQGTVLAQQPKADERVQRGQEVRINVSRGVTQTTTTTTTTTTPTRTTTTTTPGATTTLETTTTQTSTTPTTTTGGGGTTTSAAPPPPPPPVSVPDVTGQTEQTAAAQLTSAGLLADSYPVTSAEPGGTVVAQRPTSGDLAKGDIVRLNVSIGTGTRPQHEIPDVKNLAENVARARLRGIAFTVRAIYRTTKNPAAKGKVIFQSPGAGNTARARFQVTIYVGRLAGTGTAGTTTTTTP